MAHRGPDDQGYYVDGPIGFGFRRLSIIDLTGGHQPMTSLDGCVTTMVNGEVYNFRELRLELEQHGYVFRTECDSEVVLHGYRQWGDGVLDRLNGMYAIAVWDGREQRLLLARDRAGVKFLYYRLDGDELVFGSELRAVLAGCRGRPTLDPVALNLFLRYRYTPSPLTVYSGVNKLAAGTRLVVTGGKVDVQPYLGLRPDTTSARAGAGMGAPGAARPVRHGGPATADVGRAGRAPVVRRRRLRAAARADERARHWLAHVFGRLRRRTHR